MNSELLQGFYLGDLLVEPLKGQVTGSDGSRHLASKAVEVLLCLAASPGQLVSREVLLNTVWGVGRGSQEALGHAVSEIRHALDDNADNPHYIQTLPTRGYRLVIDPVAIDTHSASIIIGVDNGLQAVDIGLIENLKRRGVLEAALAYLIVGWLLIQVADIVFSQLHLPAWTGTFVTALVIAGFPIALILSWFFEFRDGKAIIHSLSPADARRRRFSRTYLSVVSALATAAVIVFVYDQFVGLPEEKSLPPPATPQVAVSDNAIAVLPFMNLDGSEETQTFANGLVDDITNRLSRVPGLLVSSRGDSFTLDPNSNSENVRRRLRVSMYLEGSVQIAGEKIRVIAQLIDSATGFHIQSRTFDRPREDFFDIRDQVTNLMVASLRVTLPEETQQLSTAATQNPDLNAYVLYRRGVDESRKPITPSTAATALGWFDAAIAVDPDYAAAYAGKCSVIADSYQLTDDPDSVPRAETECSQALQLNPNLDLVHTALGGLYALTGRHEEAESAFLQALEINPKSVSTMVKLADIYRLQQRPDEAITILRSAIGLQPGNWQPYNTLGVFLFRQGRYAEAAEQFSYVTELDDRNMQSIGNLAASYMLAGDFEAAAPVYQRSIEIEPRSRTFSNLGLMYYYLGRYEKAAAALEDGIKMAPNNHLLWMNLGDILAAADRRTEATNAFKSADELASQSTIVNPNDPALQMDRAWISAMLGREAEAMDFISRSAKSLPDDPYGDYIRALILVRYGDADEAILSLEQALAKGYSPVLIAAEPHLEALRSDMRFQALVN